MNVYHVADPSSGDDNWAATKGYADKHLKLTGGVLTGPLDITGSSRIKGKDPDGNTQFTLFPSGLIDSKSEFRSDRPNANDQCIAVKQGGTSNFIVKASGKTTSKYEVTSSDSDDTLTTKAYVDSQSTFRPAQLAWRFDGDKGTVTESPSSGKFTLSTSSGNKYLRFSFNTDNGVSLGDGKFADTNSDFDYGPVGTIWEWRSDVEKWKLKRQFRIQSWRWNFKPDPSGDAHFEFRMSSSHGHGWDQLTAGVRYYVTVGGFF